MTMTTDKAMQQQLDQQIREGSKEVDAGLKLISQSLNGRPEEFRQYEELTALLDEYRKTRDEQVAHILNGGIEEAQTLAATVQTQRYNRIREVSLALSEDSLARAGARINETAASTAELTRIFLFIGIITVLMSVAAALFLNAIIVKPLVELTEAAGRIARGDLEVAITKSSRADEIGALTKAFIAMVGYLQGMAAVSRRVAQGDLAITVKPVSDSDVLGKAFLGMTGYLRDMAEVSGKIAEGDLAVTVRPVSEKDTLGTAFVGMTVYLRELARVSRQVADGDLTGSIQPVSDRDILGGAYANMLENLRGINREVSNSVNILASSASEILASTTQIASGMIETSTSVNETTATVEEVRQTAQLSAEKSRIVSENAQKAALVADQGSDTVKETVAGINHIRQLMETVAESVVMLSEQTQAIDDIIAVVSDLAQQSNLLAVNAAIEAAKAGEQGKGFAVVAQEIKSLADQSKQATEQVRTILADIQRATGKSVLAAEQVSKAVESGVKQATDSGESIVRLAAALGESSQAADQIAASSQQQLAGMEQVAMAMENIKQAAQQNVSGTKQVEQAAHTLNELGRKLKEMVARFKLLPELPGGRKC
jgi:methyl-accepting chemotaxis protein